ncbi:SOUL family heme-binding protein [Halorarius halobius]|uniref:SOUL family heme-binding protein n=1 Tax=Halorarius halobius TaxID=2962671 RepID=UPI0020CD6AAC|nr:heme-binding protein [Halorarius halobius]
MVRNSTLLLGGVALLVLGAVAARSRRAGRETERVPYETLDRVDGVELRRYPTTLTVETVAPSTGEAFGRLFRYIDGGNDGGAEIAMTAPVATGAEIAMTAPVETDDAEEGVRMAFYLPADYEYETAPRPTDDRVALVERPARTLAVLSFSWWATDGRVARKQRDLLAALDSADVAVAGEPFCMQYDPPWTPPFLRTNEVAVEVRRTATQAMGSSTPSK